eukprot:403354892
MKHIKSEYICELLDIFTSKNQQVCIISEFAKFGDLNNYTNKTFKNGKIPENLAKEWLACAILGLRELHSRGIIHRDIKPDNILVFDETKVRIADYGLAKLFIDDRKGVIAPNQYGTLGFMSPEIAQRERYNSSTDIFSLGIAFIKILTLSIPTKEQLLDSNWLPQINEYSQEFIQVLKEMVSYEKDRRPNAMQLMFNPIFSKTQVLIDFKRRHGVLSLGFRSISQDQQEKLQQKEVGCPDCTLDFCNDCIKKKDESPFIDIKNLLQKQQDINNKIIDCFVEAQKELKVLPILNNPYIRVDQFQIVLEQVKQIVERNMRHNDIVQLTIQKIDNLQKEIETFNRKEIFQAKQGIIDSELIKINYQNLGCIDKEIQTDNFPIEINLQKDSKVKNYDDKPKNIENVQPIIEIDQNQEKLQFIEQQFELINKQLQSLQKQQETILQEQSSLKSQIIKPQTPQSSKNDQTESLFNQSLIKLNQSSLITQTTSHSQSKPRNIPKINIKRKQSTDGNKLVKSVQKQINLNRTINHERNFFDLSKIKPNTQKIDNFSTSRVTKKENQKRDTSTKKQKFNSINNTTVSSLLKQQLHNKKEIKEIQLMRQPNDQSQRRNQKFKDRNIERDLFKTFQNQKVQLSSFRLTNESYLENVLAQDLDNLVNKEISHQEDSFLKDLIPNWKKLSFKQKFKATVDGFSQQAFNKQLSSHIKGQTLVFIQSEQGQVFGGYLSQPWPKSLGKHQDKQAFIFNLTKRIMNRQLEKDSSNIDIQTSSSFPNSCAFEHNLFQLFAFGDDIRIFENCDQARTSYCNIGDTYSLPHGIYQDSKERETYMAGGVRFIVKDIIIYALISKLKE